MATNRKERFSQRGVENSQARPFSPDASRRLAAERVAIESFTERVRYLGNSDPATSNGEEDTSLRGGGTADDLRHTA